MQVDHHDLVHEFPEHREKIHQMKMDNTHFARLFDEYDELTHKIERMEKNDVPVTDEHAEDLKKQRLALKDQLFSMLQA